MTDETGSKPEPEDDEDEDALPVKLTAAKARPGLSRFGPAAIDYAINKQLQDLIPKEAGNATLSVTLRSEEGQRIVKTVAAIRTHGGWGAALGAALDLNDTRNWSVEAVIVKSWK